MHSHGHNKLNFCHSTVSHQILEYCTFSVSGNTVGIQKQTCHVFKQRVAVRLSNGPIFKCHLNTGRVRWCWHWNDIPVSKWQMNTSVVSLVWDHCNISKHLHTRLIKVQILMIWESGIQIPTVFGPNWLFPIYRCLDLLKSWLDLSIDISLRDLWVVNQLWAKFKSPLKLVADSSAVTLLGIEPTVPRVYEVRLTSLPLSRSFVGSVVEVVE